MVLPATGDKTPAPGVSTICETDNVYLASLIRTSGSSLTQPTSVTFLPVYEHNWLGSWQSGMVMSNRHAPNIKNKRHKRQKRKTTLCQKIIIRNKDRNRETKK